MSDPIFMFNKAGHRIVVGDCQVEEFRALGYMLESEIPPPAPPEVPPAIDPIDLEDAADGQAAEDAVAASEGAVPFDDAVKASVRKGRGKGK